MKTIIVSCLASLMERLNSHYSFLLFSAAVGGAGVVSLALCLAAEFKKAKRSDLRLQAGKQCYLPGSSAFGLGIAALACLSVAQIIGNVFICKKFRSRGGNSCKVWKPTYSLMALSWVFFVVAVILMSGASSMSKSQPFGEGWLDGDCYLVKNGVYSASAILALLALALTVGSGAAAVRQRQAEEGRRVHAQATYQSMLT